MSLKKNKIYSSKDLKTMFGGSIVPAMPITNGKVSYCKFDAKINQRFPDEAWVEEGKIRERGAQLITQAGEAIPVFQKIATGQWRYLGKALIKDVTSNARLAILNQKPPRDKIAVILKLTFQK